ncbi:Gti1/Pac2 family-domain-containing protein [Rhodocollybia butyracea]|uniref:Gti1/Pac2 family-domain-containing protein n=1 Tax=Rhodocollybia butyracea TaxID=206335 RepID=A0A9P5U2D5_9AGAR|nr:Gti1/Pac2 family-domain-containing protein [Rhodocollybia butyracea]
MQRPTCTMLRVRSPSDAHVLFHAVSLNLLPMVARRLDTEERRAISSGCVYIWQERGSNSESTGLGIERWTDSIRWGPSRVKDEFLFYHEKEPDAADLELASESDGPLTPHHYSRGFYRENLIKQTYSVFVATPRGQKKWHLIAYFTQESLEYLHTIDDIPGLANLRVPPGKYKSARSKNPKSSANSAYDPLAVNPYAGAGHHYAPYPLRQQPPTTTAPTYYDPTVIRPRADSILHSHSQLHPPSPRSPTRSPPRSPPSSDRFKLRPTPDGGVLAPLAYLENIPPPRRHPLDEEALMSFTGVPV